MNKYLSYIFHTTLLFSPKFYVKAKYLKGSKDHKKIKLCRPKPKFSIGEPSTSL